MLIRKLRAFALVTVARLILWACARLGLVVLRRDQLANILLLLQVEEARIRTAGGGSASKLRDPRKKLLRIVQRLGTSLYHITYRSTPVDQADRGPKALRQAARQQTKEAARA
jgi:hypothetical protein